MGIEAFSHLSLFEIYKYKAKAGSVFDAMHAPRPCFFIGAMIEGTAVFESDLGYKEEVKKGDLIFIPQGSKYRSFWGDLSNNVYISLRFNFEPNKGFPNPETLLLQKIDGEIHKNLSKKLLDAYLFYTSEQKETLRALACFYDCLASILPHLKRAPLPANDRRLSPAIDHIRTHLSEDTPASHLAALCHMSEPNLYLLFRKQMGETPVEYKNRLRIERAQQLLLLHSDMPIEQIADASGFETAAYFRRRFKEHTGESPREFRKRNPKDI
jgi:AraC-like DNA-binding protein